MQAEITKILEELRVARNQKQGDEALDKLLSYSDASYWETFARIVEDEEYDKPEYSRKIPWKLKVHILECFLRIKCEAIFETFNFLLEYEGPFLRDMYIEKLAAIGEAFSLQHIRTFLFERDDADDRKAVLEGISLSTYGAFSDEYSEGVVDLLTHYLQQQAKEEEKERVLQLVKEFSKEAYHRLKPPSPPEVSPLASGAEYYMFNRLKSFWGDYGHILIDGISWIEDESLNSEYIQLQRTGPFIPPITFPSECDIVVTDAIRKRLEESGLTGISFKPVLKVKLVKINWHEWDRDSRPEKYPAGGEPENYILRRKNRPELHEQVGDLWELCLSLKAQASKVDLFRIGEDYPPFKYVASRKAARWLLENVKGWVTITPVPDDVDYKRF